MARNHNRIYHHILQYSNQMYKFDYTVMLRKISSYEKDFTETERQRGILLKSLFLMVFNWTVPITTIHIINKKNSSQKIT
jgi:hypothetical protein